MAKLNFLDRFILKRAKKITGSHPADPFYKSLWEDLYGDDDTGVSVTPDSALTLSAWYSGVTLLSKAIAILPFIVYKRLGNEGKERAPNHNLYDILHEKPNRFQTPKEFKEMQQLCVLQRGNAYGEVISTGGRGVSEVLPLNPDQVIPFWAKDGKRAYEYTEKSGGKRYILQNEMWHIMGPSLDGLKGLNPIEYHRRTLGKSIAADKYQARFFKNDATPGIVLEAPPTMGVEAGTNLLNAWDRRHAGDPHRTGIVYEGVKVHELGLNHEDAQYLQLLKHGVADVARILHIPLHMLAELDRATFSNIEHQGLEFITYSLMYWLVTWEESAKRDLFTPQSRRTHFAEFLVDALLRADMKTRYEAYSSAVGGPWMSINQPRALENMNPVEGGDKILQPMNMQELGAAPVVPKNGGDITAVGDSV